MDRRLVTALRYVVAQFTEKNLQKMRKDVLSLLRAAEKETSYKEARHIQKAITSYQYYLEELFYKQMAPQIKNESANEDFRSKTWELYINLGMPLSLPDDYWSKEARYD